eukprot:Seg633.5 transcript_id=Seg633.5/GoldUCD/mRNA.D3Y31 product="hypothetical protein" protein_id=Seg633.5/GoldUCD/D3Y31
MPKKSAKATKEKKEEGEGRPPDLTLASFIKVSKPRGPKKSAVRSSEVEATPPPLWATQPEDGPKEGWPDLSKENLGYQGDHSQCDA